jgi:hypothetical protein
MRLLFTMLCPKPEQRASIDEVNNDSWVNQFVNISLYKWEEVIRNTEFIGNNAGDCYRANNGLIAKESGLNQDLNFLKVSANKKEKDNRYIDKENLNIEQEECENNRLYSNPSDENDKNSYFSKNSQRLAFNSILLSKSF